MRAPLRRQHNASNLFHLRVVRWADAVHVASDLQQAIISQPEKTTEYLSTQIGYDNELLEDVLRENVRVSGVLHIVRVDIDVLRTQVQIGRTDCTHTPLSPRGE